MKKQAKRKESNKYIFFLCCLFKNSQQAYFDDQLLFFLSWNISYNNFVRIHKKKTSLLRRLQAQTLSDEAPPIGKIHTFRKITITFEPVMQFGCPLRFRISYKNVT